MDEGHVIQLLMKYLGAEGGWKKIGDSWFQLDENVPTQRR